MSEQLKPLEVLIIDDNPDVGEILATMVKYNGGNTIIAKNGAEGIDFYEERINTNSYDIIFTDLKMPPVNEVEVNGVDVVRKVKATSKTPVYIITGAADDYPDMTKKSGKLRLEPDDIIQKPFTYTQIADILNTVKKSKYDTQNPNYI